MNFSLPDGLAVRVAATGDVEAITALIAACELADDGAVEIDATDVVQFLESAPDPLDAIVVTEAGRIVAWGALNGERCYVDVHPGGRGRGVGGALLAWSEDRARAHGRPLVRQTVTDNDRAAAALFRALGYAPAHTSWIIDIALGDEPSPVVVPAGIAIRPYGPENDRASHRLIDDAFSEWPGRDPLAFEDWASLVTAHGAFAPGLSRLAFDGDELVGVALAYDYGVADEGWVQQLATKASHRHRGIARALLGSVFVAFHAQGRRRTVALSTDSRTGALSLYERLGMRVRRSYTGWAKDLGQP